MLSEKVGRVKPWKSAGRGAACLLGGATKDKLVVAGNRTGCPRRNSNRRTIMISGTKSINLAHRVIPQMQGPTLRPRAATWQTELPYVLLALTLCATCVPAAGQSKSDIDEINTEFHFLGPDDTLLIHEEEGRLKGQIDAYQNDDESDTVLSYILTIGIRKGDHVEFKTQEIHRKYYRFSGSVERGSGHQEKDEDYLRLVGELQTVTVKGDTGEESVDRKQVVLKSLSADEISDE
jgi:hypothetical protein